MMQWLQTPRAVVDAPTKLCLLDNLFLLCLSSYKMIDFVKKEVDKDDSISCAEGKDDTTIRREEDVMA